MSDETCKTCPWAHFITSPAPWDPTVDLMEKAECRKTTPPWFYIKPDDWCGEHPGRQPHPERAAATPFPKET